jgi:two-component system alkaline phosphatase synthesis response regulator PhoP
MKKKVLIVEDDLEFLSLATDFLESESYEVSGVCNSTDFYKKIKEFTPDIILMDRNLSGDVDGFILIQKIRENGLETPVIFITALIKEEEVLEGLGLFNCEYLKKPFGMKELKIRIERGLHYSDAEKNLFSTKYYLEEKCAIKNGDKIISLTKIENEFLKLLVDNQDNICRLDTIIYKVWGDNDLERLNRVDVLVNKLREKLKGIPYIIENHKRIGYSLRKETD